MGLSRATLELDWVGLSQTIKPLLRFTIRSPIWTECGKKLKWACVINHKNIFFIFWHQKINPTLDTAHHYVHLI